MNCGASRTRRRRRSTLSRGVGAARHRHRAVVGAAAGTLPARGARAVRVGEGVRRIRRRARLVGTRGARRSGPAGIVTTTRPPTGRRAGGGLRRLRRGDAGALPRTSPMPSCSTSERERPSPAMPQWQPERDRRWPPTCPSRCCPTHPANVGRGGRRRPDALGSDTFDLVMGGFASGTCPTPARPSPSGAASGRPPWPRRSPPVLRIRPGSPSTRLLNDSGSCRRPGTNSSRASRAPGGGPRPARVAGEVGGLPTGLSRPSDGRRGVRTPAEIVSWRWGMAHLAPFIDGLSESRRAEARRDAEDAVAGIGPVLVDIQVLSAVAQRRRPIPAGRTCDARRSRRCQAQVVHVQRDGGDVAGVVHPVNVTRRGEADRPPRPGWRPGRSRRGDRRRRDRASRTRRPG